MDCLFETVLNKNFSRISSLFEVPSGITGAAEVTVVLHRGSQKWWSRLKANYSNRDLLSHHDQTLANKWPSHDSKLLKD